MITFLINLTTEKITDTIGKIFLYPYLKEQKLRIIDGYSKDYDNILSEIKYYMYNSSSIKNAKKEFQVFVLLSVFNEKEVYFGGNLTNTVTEIYKNLEERLAEEKLEPSSVSYLVLDHFERDFNGTPFDLNAAISEELNVKGYIETPVVTYDDIMELKKAYSKILKDDQLSEEEVFLELEDIIRTYFKDKEDSILQTEFGKIVDSAVRKHLQKYNILKSNLLESLRYDKKDGIIQPSKFEEIFISILKINGCFYDYLFTTDDLKELESVYNACAPLLKEEEKFNLSEEFIKKVKNLIEKLDEAITQIIKKKKDILEIIDKKDKKGQLSKNCYINKNTLNSIEKKFREEYLGRYLKKIIDSRRMDTPLLTTPVDKLKGLLNAVYSLKKIFIYRRNNMYRIPFHRNNNSKYNENILNYTYFMMFLMEYGENKDYYLENGKFLYLDKIEYRIKYLTEIFEKYTRTLEKEKMDINYRQGQLKNTAEIHYYRSKDKEKDANYKNIKVDGSIANCMQTSVEFFYDNDTFKKYKSDWLDFIKKGLDLYIDTAEEGLSVYQNKENEFANIPRSKEKINQNIEIEVKEREADLHNCRVALGKCEKDVVIDVKNEWKKLNDENAPEELIKENLERRPNLRDVTFLCGSVSAIFAFASGMGAFVKYSSFSAALVVGIIGFVITVILFALVVGHFCAKPRKEARRLIGISNRIKNEYTEKLHKIFDKRKEYIDRQVKCKIAEKNYGLARQEEKRINAEIEILGSYIEIINNHCQIIENVSNTLKNLKYQDVNEMEYINESFNGKLKKLDSQRAPFENSIFNLNSYIEIQEYKKFCVNYNGQENSLYPENIFGCEVINIQEDNIYKKVEE